MAFSDMAEKAQGGPLVLCGLCSHAYYVLIDVRKVVAIADEGHSLTVYTLNGHAFSIDCDNQSDLLIHRWSEHANSGG